MLQLIYGEIFDKLIYDLYLAFSRTRESESMHNLIICFSPSGTSIGVTPTRTQQNRCDSHNLEGSSAGQDCLVSGYYLHKHCNF